MVSILTPPRRTSCWWRSDHWSWTTFLRVACNVWTSTSWCPTWSPSKSMCSQSSWANCRRRCTSTTWITMRGWAKLELMGSLWEEKREVFSMTSRICAGFGTTLPSSFSPRWGRMQKEMMHPARTITLMRRLRRSLKHQTSPERTVTTAMHWRRKRKLLQRSMSQERTSLRIWWLLATKKSSKRRPAPAPGGRNSFLTARVWMTSCWAPRWFSWWTSWRSPPRLVTKFLSSASQFSP